MTRFGRSAALVPALLVPALGCYSYATPVTDRPQPATIVEVTLNDRGRVAMEGNVGPEILSIEGAVQSAAESLLVLNVQRTISLDRTASRWNGEPVTIRMEHVRQLRERRFSATRTVLLVGSATATAAAVVAAGALEGFGGRGGPTGSDPGNPSDSRVRRP